MDLICQTENLLKSNNQDTSCYGRISDETYSLVCNGENPEGTDKYKYWFLISLFKEEHFVKYCCRNYRIYAA